MPIPIDSLNKKVRIKHCQRLYRRALRKGVSHDEVRAMLLERFQVTTSKDLTRSQYQHVMDWLAILPIIDGAVLPLRFSSARKLKVTDQDISGLTLTEESQT